MGPTYSIDSIWFWVTKYSWCLNRNGDAEIVQPLFLGKVASIYVTVKWAAPGK